MAYPTGSTYSREEIRRLIEEDKRKRKKIILIAVPSFIVLAGIVAVLLIFLVFGGGMSPGEYKEQALVIHDRAMAQLEIIEDEWDKGEVSEDSYSVSWQKYGAVAGESIPVLENVQADLASLETPQEVASLQEELDGFYQWVEDYLLRSQAASAFAAEWSVIWGEYCDYQYAMDRANSRTTYNQAIALFDEDITRINGFCTRFQSLPCPEECRGMLDGTTALMSEESGLLGKMKAAYASYNTSAYDTAIDNYQSFVRGVNDRRDQFMVVLGQQRMESLSLMEEGKKLQDKLSVQEVE